MSDRYNKPLTDSGDTMRCVHSLLNYTIIYCGLQRWLSTRYNSSWMV